MSYALVEDIPASWERYRAIARSIAAGPRGLVLHVAGPTDEGFRIIEVWESEAAWLAFRGQFEAALDAADPDFRPRAAIRDLQGTHLVAGERWPEAVGPGLPGVDGSQPEPRKGDPR
jgi:hypothetical protein